VPPTENRGFSVRHYPITPEGRLTAILLMFAGVGLIGIFTAFITSSFIESEQKLEKKEIVGLIAEIKFLSEKIERLEKKIDDSSH
jgi:voltage-gated potassium channel